MAEGTILTTTVILVIINLLSVFYGSALGVTNIGDVVVNSIFDKDTLNTPDAAINSNLDAGIQKDVLAAGTTGGLLDFVDGLKAVFSFIINLLLIGFAMFNMLYQTGAPVYFIWLLGLPLAVSFYIGIASFIRGFSG